MTRIAISYTTLHAPSTDLKCQPTCPLLSLLPIAVIPWLGGLYQVAFACTPTGQSSLRGLRCGHKRP